MVNITYHLQQNVKFEDRASDNKLITSLYLVDICVFKPVCRINIFIYYIVNTYDKIEQHIYILLIEY